VTNYKAAFEQAMETLREIARARELGWHKAADCEEVAQMAVDAIDVTYSEPEPEVKEAEGPYKDSHSEAYDLVSRIETTLGRDWLRTLASSLPRPPPKQLPDSRRDAPI
jgi:hypothetical protein